MLDTTAKETARLFLSTVGGSQTTKVGGLGVWGWASGVNITHIGQHTRYNVREILGRVRGHGCARAGQRTASGAGRAAEYTGATQDIERNGSDAQCSAAVQAAVMQRPRCYLGWLMQKVVSNTAGNRVGSPVGKRQASSKAANQACRKQATRATRQQS